MRTIILAMAFAILTQIGFGQIVSSSCTAHDSIVKKYSTDVAILTVRKIYLHNLTYIDSIEIPQTYADTILNALVAVYNATTLPARDTVVTMYNIHSFPDPDINSFSVTADSNLTWMQQLKNGIFPTGNSTIDSLTNLYNLNVISYIKYSGLNAYHTVSFQSDSNYNIPPLSNIFKTISGVYFSDPGYTNGDGDDITVTTNSDHIELIYSVGWEDCPSGCLQRRYWKFKVYFDCSVEFVSSYGSSLPITAIGELGQDLSIIISPNPFDNHLDFKGIGSNYDYVIYNIVGQELIRGQLFENQLQNLDWMPSGQYLIQLKADRQSTVNKLIKK